MRPKTTALVAASALLAVPAAGAADPLKPAVGDHETVAAQMRSEARDNRREDVARRALRLARRVAADNGERDRRLRTHVSVLRHARHAESLSDSPDGVHQAGPFRSSRSNQRGAWPAAVLHRRGRRG